MVNNNINKEPNHEDNEEPDDNDEDNEEPDDNDEDDDAHDNDEHEMEPDKETWMSNSKAESSRRPVEARFSTVVPNMF